MNKPVVWALKNNYALHEQTGACSARHETFTFRSIRVRAFRVGDSAAIRPVDCCKGECDYSTKRCVEQVAMGVLLFVCFIA